MKALCAGGRPLRPWGGSSGAAGERCRQGGAPWRAAQSRACWGRPPGCHTLLGGGVGWGWGWGCRGVGRGGVHTCPPQTAVLTVDSQLRTDRPCSPGRGSLSSMEPHPSAAPRQRRWGRRVPRCIPGLQQEEAGQARVPMHRSTAFRALGASRVDQQGGWATSRGGPRGRQRRWRWRVAGAAAAAALVRSAVAPRSSPLPSAHQTAWPVGRSSCRHPRTPAARAREFVCSMRAPW